MTNTHPPEALKPNAEQTKPKRVSWEDVALWVFLVGMFVLALVAGYLFWLKVSFRAP
jgi:hypothetical protein